MTLPRVATLSRGSPRQTDYGIAIMGLAGGAAGAPHVALAVDNQDEPDTKAGQLPGAILVEQIKEQFCLGRIYVESLGALGK